jgi:hypothetical protein
LNLARSFGPQVDHNFFLGLVNFISKESGIALFCISLKRQTFVWAWRLVYEFQLSMSCVYSTHLVSDFKSDHSPHTMSNKNSATPQRRKDTFPVRTVLPSREPSKEDLELAQHLIGHAQGIRGDPIAQDGESSRSTPSPACDASTPGSASPSVQRLREIASRSSSLERSQQDPTQSHQRAQSIQSDAVPAGQVCRSVL